MEYVISRIRAISCGVVCLCTLAATRASGQCGSNDSLQMLLAQHPIDVMFVGRADHVEQVRGSEVVTFVAERVWRGAVTTRMTIYRPLPTPPDATATPFHVGQRYLVLAHRLSAVEGRQLNVDRVSPEYGTDVCGDGSRRLSNVEPDLATMGPGRGPIDQQVPVRGAYVAQPIKVLDVVPVYRPPGRVMGTVILSITIDETGGVNRAEVVRSIPLFDQAAIDCVLKWKYLPPLINGIPGATLLMVTVPFVPSRNPQ